MELLTGNGADRLAREHYISLATFRSDGQAVSTPVWFAIDGDRLVIWTDASSGKIRRLRADDRVLVAPCDVHGQVTGEAAKGSAQILSMEDGARVQRLLDRRYGWTKRVYTTILRLWRVVRRRPASLAAYIEVTLLESNSTGQ